MERSCRRLRFASRGALRRLLILALIIAGALLACHESMIRMPGKSYRGPLPPLTDSQRELARELSQDVDMLAGVIGRRNVYYPKGLAAAADFIEKSLSDAGYAVERQSYEVFGVRCDNLIVEIPGAKQPDEIVIVGAHYDSVHASPAANDNGSGVAATLALARRFAPGNRGTGVSPVLEPRTGETPMPPSLSSVSAPDRTLRFVFFVNEEPPHFQTDSMGSVVYARRCRARGENIVGMISLETIGCYSDEPGSQVYPVAPIGWLYPDTGNFIGFVGNHASRKLVRTAIASFRKHAQFPSEGAALPGWITGVGWSDQWSFWQEGYPALMITDTAPFRYQHYHSETDTPEKLDYERMARVVEGVEAMVRDLAAK